MDIRSLTSREHARNNTKTFRRTFRTKHTYHGDQEEVRGGDLL